jgi:adenosylmethionine-8-amino-7-oxononanoate aminotransferase
MKMAAQYWLNQGVRTRTRILAFTGRYHGDTFAAMAVCAPEEGMHAVFGPLLPNHAILPLPNDAESDAALDAYVAEHSAQLAGIPLVQGAGGMIFHPPHVLRRARAGR